MTETLWLNLDANTTARAAVTHLEARGFEVLPSFSLGAALAGKAVCGCRAAADEPCECQLIVLLVYGPAGQPATLTLRGRSGRTRLQIEPLGAEHETPDGGELLAALAELVPY